MSQKAKQMVEEIQVSYKVECSLPSAPRGSQPLALPAVGPLEAPSAPARACGE